MTAPTMGSREAIAWAAQRLGDAARTGVPCSPVRDLVGPTDVDAAYAVQQVLRDEAVAVGRRVVGRKIGLTPASRGGTSPSATRWRATPRPGSTCSARTVSARTT